MAQSTYKPPARPTPILAPVPVTAPSIASGMQDLSGQYVQAFKEAENFGRMNPEVVKEALANGGALSSALGFSSPVSTLGLSPQELLALTQGQGIQQQLAQSGQNFDMITGGKETRDAKRAIADRLFTTGSQALAQDAGNQVQVNVSNANRGMQVDLANADREFRFDMETADREQRALETRLAREDARAIAAGHDASAERIARMRMKEVESMKLGQQAFGMLDREQKLIDALRLKSADSKVDKADKLALDLEITVRSNQLNPQPGTTFKLPTNWGRVPSAIKSKYPGLIGAGTDTFGVNSEGDIVAMQHVEGTKYKYGNVVIPNRLKNTRRYAGTYAEIQSSTPSFTPGE